MSTFRRTLIIFGVALMASVANAAQVDNSTLAKSDSDLDKSPNVFVDIAGLETVEGGRTISDPVAQVILAAKPEATAFGTGPAMVDPLNQPLTESVTATRAQFDWSGMERWTRHPMAAAGISVAVVFLGYFLLKLSRGRGSARRPGQLPRQVVELIGFVPLGQRQQLQLVRLGSKLVLVAVSANGAEPLAEVTDPVEVDQILTACQSGQSALAGAIGRWTGRQPARDYGRADGRNPARALFEA